jgi:hypothetical protein
VVKKKSIMHVFGPKTDQLMDILASKTPMDMRPKVPRFRLIHDPIYDVLVPVDDELATDLWVETI